jgi:hypothetical protein
MTYEHAAAPGLSVSFQRYPCPASGTIDAVPDSRGALPLHRAGAGRLVLPCPAAEAFWIGLIAEPGGPPCHVGVLVTTASGARLDAITGAPPADAVSPVVVPPAAAPDEVTPTGVVPGGVASAGGGEGGGRLVVPPAFAVPGIANGGGWWPLARAPRQDTAPACRFLDLLIGPREPAALLRVEVVEPAAFEKLTATPLPGPLPPSTRPRLP